MRTVHSLAALFIAIIAIPFQTNAQISTGTSLGFDGVNDYVEYVNAASDFGAVANFKDAFTFEAWVLNQGSGVWGRVFDFGDSTNEYILFTPNSGVDGNGLMEYRFFGGFKYRLSAPAFPAGWTHLACTLDELGNAKVYYDGVEVASASGWPKIDNIFGVSRAYLGKSQFADPYFKGRMQDVRVWKTARTQQEIMDNKDCYLSGNEPGLISNLKMRAGLGGQNNSSINNIQYIPEYARTGGSYAIVRNGFFQGNVANFFTDGGLALDPNENNTVSFFSGEDYIKLSNESNFDFDEEYTIEMWFHPHYLDADIQQFVNKGNLAGPLTFYANVNNSRFEFGHSPSAGVYERIITSAITTEDEWCHLAMTAKEENGNLRYDLYKNGERVTTKFINGASIPQTNEQVILGRHTHGRMSNIRFWDKALSQSVIVDNMSTIYDSGTPSLVSQYNEFNDFSAGLKDGIGNNDGVRNEVPIFISDPCYVQYTVEPVSGSLSNLGESLTLSADINSCTDKEYSYQWQFEEIDIPGATSKTLMLSNIQLEDLGRYRLKTTACGQEFFTRTAIVDVENQGKVLHFDGVDDQLRMTEGIHNAAFTIETWVRFDEDPLNQSIIALGDQASNFEDELSHHISINDYGQFEFLLYSRQTGDNNEARKVTYPDKVEANRWYHVAARQNASTLQLRIDGVLAPSVPVTGIESGTDWNIGGPIQDYRAFHGEIADLRIWELAVDTRLQQTISSGAADLVFNLRFDEGIGGGDNTSPITIDTVRNEVDGSSITQIELLNFSLKGSESNWLPCDNYDTQSTVTITNESRNTNGGIGTHVRAGAEIRMVGSVNDGDGTELYQWYKDGVAILGATDSTFVKMAQAGDDGIYTLSVSGFNRCPSFSQPIEFAILGSAQTLSFDGVDDHVVIDQSVGTDFTIEAWVKFDSDPSDMVIITGSLNEQDPVLSFSHQLYVNQDKKVSFHLFDSGASERRTIVSDEVVEVNKWYHVVGRSSNVQEMQLLIDGVEQSQSASINGNLTGISTFWLGSSALTELPGGAVKRLKPFHGEIEELRLWDEWRSTAAINSVIDREFNFGNFHPDTYLKFNQGVANGDNSGFNPDYLASYSTPVDFVFGKASMRNFALEGEQSNLSTCSPITVPIVILGSNAYIPVVGQNVKLFNAFREDDIEYEWMYNGQIIPGQNSDTLLLSNFQYSDTGRYELITRDFCDPQFADTSQIDINTVLCLSDLLGIEIDPLTQAQYDHCFSDFNFCLPGDTIIFFNPQIESGYCSSDTSYFGPERIYKFSLPEDKVIQVFLSDLNKKADIFLFGDDCSIATCLGQSTNPGLEDEFFQAVTPAGDYTLIIEMELLSDDSLEYLLDFIVLEDQCVSSEAISCEDSITANTAGGSDLIDDYCGVGGYIGEERVYRLELSNNQTLDISLSGLTEDLDLFLLDSTCTVTNCRASSTLAGVNEENILIGATPGIYYIVVDGKDGVTGDFSLSLQCTEYFSASKLDNDAYVDLSWFIDKNLCVPQDTGVIVRLIEAPATILYEETFNTAALTPDVIIGSYRHYIGDDEERRYALRVINRLSNETICNEIDTGMTTPFAAPEIVFISSQDDPDSIRVTWRNHSKLSDQFRVFRDGEQLINLTDGYNEDSLLISYVDVHDINDPASIQADSSYEYCIETFSVQLNQSYAQVCSTGSTYDVDFQATQGNPTDRIDLTWADVSEFCSAIQIRRNGINLVMLSANETSFSDLSPLFGVETEYSLIFLNGSAETMQFDAQGFAPANGSISGRVSTLEGDYPVAEVKIVLQKDTIIDGSSSLTSIDSTTTDFSGSYQFDDIVYGLSTDFTVSASKDGSVFQNNDQLITLSEVNRQLTNVDFIDETSLQLRELTGLVDSFTSEIFAQEDYVKIDWHYSYDSADTLFFNLYREGELLFSESDAQGAINTYNDFSGVPGQNYTYTLQAYRLVGDSTFLEEFTQDILYPELTPVQGLAVFAGSEAGDGGEIPDHNPRNYLNWFDINHPSQNFDGFRIFRNGIQIAEVDENTDQYVDELEPGLAVQYSIRAFKEIDGINYQSQLALADPDTVQTKTLWEPIISGINVRRVTLDIGSLGYQAEFFAADIYDGVLIERLDLQDPEASYVLIGEFSREYIAALAEAEGLQPEFYDQLAVPGVLYSYRLSTYKDINGQRYTNSTTDIASASSIPPPFNFNVTNLEGQVDLDWTDNSTSTGPLSLLFVHYDGVEIRRVDGADTTLIATLPSSQEDYSDYINNPIYDLFEDDYINKTYTYILQSYLDIDGVRYRSAPMDAQGSPLPGANEEPLPTQLVASKNIPNHIKLCWDWTAGIQADFIIYRNDSIPLDTLPFTARAYYDYDAPVGQTVVYSVSTLLQGNESAKVSTEGLIPSTTNISGRVYNFFTDAGIEGALINYENLPIGDFAQGDFFGNVETDVTGNYTIEGLPSIPGISFLIDVTKVNTDFNPDPDLYQSVNTENFALNLSGENILDFIDYVENVDTISFAQVRAVTAEPDFGNMVVQINWSLSNQNYDGVEIFRANSLIGEVMKGDGHSFSDNTGFPGIPYAYGVIAFRNTIEGRKYTELATTGATYPDVAPVENLSATGFFDQNKMLISWSHPYNDHDVYRVLRNGIFQDTISTDEPMMWYDTTGIPGRQYQYEVTAIKGNLVSPVRIVTANFKGVGEVIGLSTSIDNTVPACAGITTNSNHVLIQWQYQQNAAQGFEIYRDNELIAEIDSNVISFGDLPVKNGDLSFSNETFFYRDYAGLPGTTHAYHVLAYVEREGLRYASGIEELYPIEIINYPDLSLVTNLDIGANDVLGSVQLIWSYPSQVVDGFEILRDGQVLDTIVAGFESNFIYQDITGQPAQNYEYGVRAFDLREGTVYFSETTCAKIQEFPIVPTPQNLFASQGEFLDHIEVSWNFDRAAFVDSIYLENLSTGITSRYAGGKRLHQDIVTELLPAEFVYRVRAARAINGQLIYSDWSEEVIGWSQKQINGDQQSDIIASADANLLGYHVDIDGDWAVAGAPDGCEQIAIYRRVEGGWSLFQTLDNPTGTANADFGHSVSISGERIAVGAPLALSTIIYQFDGLQWVPFQRIAWGAVGWNTGWTVSLDGDNLGISAPTAPSGGRLRLYEYDGSTYVEKVQITGYDWDNDGSTNSTALNYFAEDLDFYDDMAVFSITEPGGLRRWLISYLKDANGIWQSHELYPQVDSENFPRPSNRVKLLEDVVVYGDFVEDNGQGVYQGEVKIYRLGSDKLISSQESIELVGPAERAYFGFDVSAAYIPSPIEDALYVAVGAVDGGDLPFNQFGGESYLFTDRSGSWEELREIKNEDAAQNDQMGRSIALSKNAIIYGTPFKYDNDRGHVGLINLIAAPINTKATDGISADLDPTRTTITWDYDGDELLISGFNIYRDDEFVAFRDIATMSQTAPGVFSGTWDDNTGNAGQRYIYSVRSVNNLSGFESYGSADEGYNAPDGKIQGTVVTAQGGIPVPGVNITAVGFVNNERYEYTGITFPNGEYVLTNVFYDSHPDSVSQYTVSASLSTNNIIASGTDVATLNSLNQPVVGVVNFLDNSAYVITGQVVQTDVNCPVEGLRVAPVYNGVESFADETTTDENGNYSIVINPNDPTLNELRIRVNNIWTENMDSLQYGFVSMDDTVFTDFVNFPFITEINYVDTLTYPVELSVRNTCDDAIDLSSWDIRIRTVDGCFDLVYTTDFNGRITADLYPLDYVMEVVDASETNSRTQAALNYFAGKPVTLNLLSLHQDSLSSLGVEGITASAKRKFVYHVAPEIEITGEMDFFCNQPVGVLQQGETYTLNIDIRENFGGTICPVQEGKIRIYNPAARDELNTILEYDPILETFPSYTFTAGDPLQADPFIYGATVDYLSDEDDFLGTTVASFFVEGAVRLPGSDIIVDPTAGNDAVPMPLFVLRDPPGDHSYSYISGGQTVSYTTSVSETNSNEQNVFLNTNVVALGAADIGINGNFETGSGSTNGREYSSEVTISQTIKTSDDEFFIGRNADIIVGQGLVMTNGIVRQYSVGNCDTIDILETVAISPDAAATTWSYTIEQIEAIITGYQNDSTLIEMGEKQIEERGEILSTEDALKRMTSYIKNWKSVLQYHGENTVPHYRICAEDPPIGTNPFVFNQQEQIDEWQAQLCPLLGTGEGEDFQLYEEIIWSQATMDMYNAAFFSIDNIAKGANIDGRWTYPSNGNIQTILNYPAVSGHINSFGAPVKNITTGGFVEIEESFQSVNSRASSHEANYFRSGGFGVTATFSADLTVVFGGFAGAGLGAFAGVFGGVVREVFSKNLSVGSDFNWRFEKTRSSEFSIENSIETGYVIFDDDITDQFSMSVIQPVNQNQTAFFDYFGGRTSCPPEPGSIAVDDPTIFIVNEDGSLTDNKRIENIPPDGVAVFTIQVDNRTPVPDKPDRDTRVFLEQSSNTNGAVIRLNGVNLNTSVFEDSLAADSPVELTLTIERGPEFFEYEDLQIFISPTCFEQPRKEIFVSAIFQSPCSPVTITSPDNNWLVNDFEPLVISMQDYDPDNASLDKATLQYRPLGSGEDWQDVNALQLEEGNEISGDSLAAHNAGLAQGQTPTYDFIWNVPSDFVDGEYEVRIEMSCDMGNVTTLSNSVSGRIARNTLNLFGTPQPADQVWTPGDEISFSFNLPLNCILVDNEVFEEENVYLYNETTGDTLDFRMDCYGNQLVFIPDQPMSDFDGDFLTVSVNDVVSTNGNISEQFTWTFRVVTQQVYWADSDTIKLRLYQNDSTSIEALINNIEQFPIPSLSLSATDGILDTWLEISDPTGLFDVPPITGTVVQIDVNADAPLGVYHETIQIDGLSGRIPKLLLELEILAEAPDWVVETSDYSTTMNIISNWRYTDDAPEAKSIDEADIISVWSGSELRGVANIQEAGNFFAAYLTVYGNPEDDGSAQLEFRVWDADLGREYDGRPLASIFYQSNALIGATDAPEMLLVDSLTDLARYIILPNAGWNGFSLNSETTDMDMDHKLRSLKHVSDGDLIVNGEQFRQYSDSLGWFNVGPANLENANTNDGYMIYLQNGPDTLRVTGANAVIEDIELDEGWNWIGYPLQDPSALTDVNDVNAFELQSDNGLFRLNMEFPIEGSTAGFSVYNNATGTWDLGSLPALEPNNLYKIFVENPLGSTLCWGSCDGIEEPPTSRLNVVADPEDESTWNLPDFATEDVMPMVSQVIKDGSIQTDASDVLMLFEADTVRAYATVQYSAELDEYIWSFITEEISSASSYDIYYYDASADTILRSGTFINYDRDGKGDFFDPFIIDLDKEVCVGILYLTAADSPLSGTYKAAQQIIINTTLAIPANTEVILSAPEVDITADFITGDNAILSIEQEGCGQ